MTWMSVLSLSDGACVESSMPTAAEVGVGLADRPFRLCLPDGSVEEFPTLATIVSYLGDHYSPEDLGTATRQATQRTG